MSTYLYRLIANEKLAAAAAAAAAFKGSGWWMELEVHRLPWQFDLPHPPTRSAPGASQALPQPHRQQ